VGPEKAVLRRSSAAASNRPALRDGKKDSGGGGALQAEGTAIIGGAIDASNSGERTIEDARRE